MSDINVDSTVETIEDMARKMRQYALDVERVAARMRETGDITYASEVMQSITNMNTNLRLDLLITKPIRALQRNAGE